MRSAGAIKNIKITSGIYRGRTISSPYSDVTHPMGSRERLSLMNALGPDVLTDAKVLDAFAGTGALGLEALSRGAKNAVFVEKDRHAAATIRRNLKFLKLADQDGNPVDNVKLFEQSVETFSKTYQGAPFSLIFVDPPYSKISKKLIRPLVLLLENNGILAISHPSNFSPLSISHPDAPLELLSTRKMAAANISILQKKC